jgi:hypothetical protein
MINNILPSVKEFAGAGRYYEEGRKKPEYDTLRTVLAATRKGSTIDILCKVNR